MSQALIPVKDLAAGKSRMASRLPRLDVASLCLAMLEDLIEALAGCASIRGITVVTPDPRVAACAESAGARIHVGPDPGLNPALDAAADAVCRDPAAPLLVVLGDVAGARSEDFDALFEALDGLGGRGVVIAPSDDGGTAALLRAPRDAIPSLFGPESARRHREAADREGVPVVAVPRPGLAIDLDVAEDVERFLEGPGAGPRTRALLRGFAEDAVRG